LISSGIKAQNTHWQAVTPDWQAYQTKTIYSDTVDDRLYIGGYTASGICYYDGDSITAMGNVLCTGGVQKIIRYNDTLYIGGNCGTRSILKWNGTIWDTVGISANGWVSAFYVWNNELYVGGSFTSIGGVNANSLAKYDGSSWSPVGNYPGNNNFISQGVFAITVYNGELFVGGLIIDSAGNQTNLLRWNGTNWGNVGQGLHGGWSYVNAFAEYNSQLYIGGAFTVADGNPGDYIVKWDGTTLSDVGGGVMGEFSSNGRVHDLRVYNNALYAGGAFSYAGGVFAQYIAKWDGTNWCGFGDTLHNIVVALETFRGDLYMGGTWWIIGSDTLAGAAKWIGGTYVDTCGILSTGVTEQTQQNLSVHVFPNPVTTNATFTIKGLEGNKSFIIYDQLGKEVWKRETGENQIEFSTEGIAAGLYFYRIENGKGIMSVGKLIIQ
jgi:hypothetical protein